MCIIDKLREKLTTVGRLLVAILGSTQPTAFVRCKVAAININYINELQAYKVAIYYYYFCAHS